MHYFSNKFLKIAEGWGLTASKLRDLTKLWFFKLIVTKSNFKKSVKTSFCDVVAITSAKLRHQNNVTKFFYFAPPSSKFQATPVQPTNPYNNCSVLSYNAKYADAIQKESISLSS